MEDAPSPPAHLPVPSRPVRAWRDGILIVVAALAAYANTLGAPFIFDDRVAIVENPTIRDLGSLQQVLAPPADGSGVTGRPLVNLSLALNYALGGLDVRGYHLANLALHAAAGLALLGVVRRTLESAPLRGRFGAAARPLALVIALLWTLHPLQTESVTCVVQRTESLMGLFFLVTLYGFIRAAERPDQRPWPVVTVAACLAGMATKEVMVAAPVLLLLYDRTFVAGSFGAAWRARRGLHAGLAATWLLLGALVLGQHGSRGHTEGAAVAATMWAYALTQCEALGRYVSLAFWPHPLVLDYGTALTRHLMDVLPLAVLWVALLAATLAALGRRPVAGFLGAWFFCLLAPSSSVVPLLPQPIAEHRMYLPLLALVAPGVACGYLALGRRCLGAALLGLAALALATAARNRDYASAESIWRDTIAKQPRNARGFYNLGCVLDESGRQPEALALYTTAVRLQPAYAEAHSNLGRGLALAGRAPEAIPHLETALRLKPALADARVNFGIALLGVDRTAEAIAAFSSAIALRPDDAQAHAWLGGALLRAQRLPEAVRHLAEAARLRPDYAEAHNNWGIACLLQGQASEGIAHFQLAVRAKPDFADAHKNLGLAFSQTGLTTEARTHLQTALRLRPDDPATREALARLAPPAAMRGAP